MGRTFSSGAVALFVASVIIIAGLLIWSEFDSWQIEFEEVERRAVNSAVSAAQQADQAFQELTTVVVAIAASGSDAGKVVTSAELTEYRDNVRAMGIMAGDLFVLNREGRTLVSSVRSGADRLGEDAVRLLLEEAGGLGQSGYRIGKLIKSTAGNTLIPIIAPTATTDGLLDGAVVATVDIRHFSGTYQDNVSTNGKALVLFTSGGTQLLASSGAESKQFADFAEIFEKAGEADRGTFRYFDATEGEQRIAAFYKSWFSGLIVVSSIDQGVVLSQWMKAAQYRWALIAVLVTLAAIMVLFVAKQRRRQEELDAKLNRREWEFRVLAENTGDLVGRLNFEGIWQYASPAARSVLRVDPKDLLGQNALEQVFEQDIPAVSDAVDQLMHQRSPVTVEYRLAGQPSEVWLEATLSILPSANDPDLNGIVCVTRDISSRKRLEAAMTQLASIDWLTGLANRRVFEQQLARTVADRLTSGLPVSLVLVDVDHFKMFNDTYGHACGDECLKAVGEAIARVAFDVGGIAARYGGEEIGIILQDTDERDAYTVAETIRAQVEAIGIFHERNVPWGRVTISSGVATLRSSELSPENLVRVADDRLYLAKKDGRNRVVGASPSLAA